MNWSTHDKLIIIPCHESSNVIEHPLTHAHNKDNWQTNKQTIVLLRQMTIEFFSDNHHNNKSDELTLSRIKTTTILSLTLYMLLLFIQTNKIHIRFEYIFPHSIPSYHRFILLIKLFLLSLKHSIHFTNRLRRESDNFFFRLSQFFHTPEINRIVKYF